MVSACPGRSRKPPWPQREALQRFQVLGASTARLTGMLMIEGQTLAVCERLGPVTELCLASAGEQEGPRARTAFPTQP